MTGPVSSNPSDNSYPPSGTNPSNVPPFPKDGKADSSDSAIQQALAKVNVKGCEWMLKTPFGKMFTDMPGASSTDQTTLLKEIKTAMDTYCKQIMQQMKREQDRMTKALEKMKRAES